MYDDERLCELVSVCASAFARDATNGKQVAHTSATAVAAILVGSLMRLSSACTCTIDTAALAMMLRRALLSRDEDDDEFATLRR